MLQAGVLLAEARSTFLKPDITAMEVGTFGLLAPSSIVPRLANLLASFDLADGLEGIALDLPLSFRKGGPVQQGACWHQSQWSPPKAE